MQCDPHLRYHRGPPSNLYYRPRGTIQEGESNFHTHGNSQLYFAWPFTPTSNAIKTLLSQILNNCYQKHLIMLQKLVFNVSTTSTHTNFEFLLKVFVVLLMRSRNQSSQNNANATLNTLILETHQHDHQTFYKETQNLCW